MKNDDSRNSGRLKDPVKEQQRISSVDVLRGVALLGILVINIVGMALPDPAFWDPSGYGGDTGWNLRVFFMSSLFFEGTMRAIFSMLFGAGVILFTERKEAEGAGSKLVRAWYRRVAWLIVFGLFHAYVLIWPGEILYFYGVVGMFIYPVRHVSPAKLIGFSIFLFMLITYLNITDSVKVHRLQNQSDLAQEYMKTGGEATESQIADLKAWEDKQAEYKLDDETKEWIVENMRSGYFSAVKTMAPISQFIQTTYFLRSGFLDVLSMMLLGMGLFKLRIFHGERKTGFYTLMVLTGYGIGLPVNWHETTSYINENYSVLSYFTNQQTYEVGRIFTSLGHVGLVMLFMKSPVLGFLKRSLASVGRMALSNYIAHTVVATTIFGIFRQFGQWQRYELYYLVMAVWIVQLIFSPLWLNHFHFGPLEWLWRWLTYGKRPPFHRII